LIIPYKSEVLKLLKNNNDKRRHISSKRVFDEIINENYFWKGMRNDCITYIGKCPIGTKERFVIHSWKLNNEIATLSSYSWVIDIISFQ
jgi:hypothetical protein